LLDADADRADLELRLIKLTPKDRARVHPFAGNGSSWRKAVIADRACRLIAKQPSCQSSFGRQDLTTPPTMIAAYSSIIFSISADFGQT
jgi:hypothetical protein